MSVSVSICVQALISIPDEMLPFCVIIVAACDEECSVSLPLSRLCVSFPVCADTKVPPDLCACTCTTDAFIHAYLHAVITRCRFVIVCHIWIASNICAVNSAATAV